MSRAVPKGGARARNFGNLTQVEVMETRTNPLAPSVITARPRGGDARTIGGCGMTINRRGLRG